MMRRTRKKARMRKKRLREEWMQFFAENGIPPEEAIEILLKVRERLERKWLDYEKAIPPKYETR